VWAIMHVDYVAPSKLGMESIARKQSATSILSLSLMYMDIFFCKLLGLYVVRDSAIECAPTMKIRCVVLIQIAGGNRAMVSCSSAVLYFWLSLFCRLSTCQVSTLSVSIKYVGSWCKLNA
jgi:hypothetical protein